MNTPSTSTSTSNEDGEHTFSRSQTTPRSPILIAHTTMSTQQQTAVHMELDALSQATTKEVLPVNPQNIHERPEFINMGKAIDELELTMADESRRTLTAPMRAAFKKIRDGYKKLVKLAASQKGTEKQESASQTSPFFRLPANKRREPDDKVTPKAKRAKAISSPAITVDMETPATVQSLSQTPQNTNEWTKVEKKKVGRNIADKKTEEKVKHQKRLRPDAIIIKAAEGSSYADILRKIKTDVSLKTIGDAVTTIRRTATGDLLLQLKNTSEKTASYRSSINEALGSEVEVRALSQKTLIEIRHIDEITTSEDVLDAIKGKLDNYEISATTAISMRKSFGSTQIASISLPARDAQELLKLEKIKIGWTVCPIREKTTLKKCFRCLEYGHIAKLCQNEDRAKLCRRCGEGGHIAKDCKKEASCMFCKSSGLVETKHIAGSGRCPTLKKALENRK